MGERELSYSMPGGLSDVDEGLKVFGIENGYSKALCQTWTRTDDDSACWHDRRQTPATTNHIVVGIDVHAVTRVGIKTLTPALRLWDSPRSFSFNCSCANAADRAQSRERQEGLILACHQSCRKNVLGRSRGQQ
jgi:hypothetical protein